MSDGFRVRRASATDADILAIARQRALMFRDMGRLGPEGEEGFETLVVQTTAYLHEAVQSGEYVAWLATPAGESDRVVAGAGVQRRRILPFPETSSDNRTHIAEGREAIVLNVFTEPPFRRRGLARALMQEVLAWAVVAKVERLVLHAAPDGRPLYESLGFVSTSEMRFVSAEHS